MKASKKKSHLRVVAGGKKGSATTKLKQVLAQDRPRIGVIPAEKLDPKKGLRAKDYLEKDPPEQQGRSKLYPEINVLNSAKAWYRSMLRLAGPESDMKKFFEESALVNDHDKRLFDAVGALIEWENKLRRGG